MKKQIFAILITLIVAGCASLTVVGTAIPTGEKRPPIPQDQVMMYLTAPENALKVGTIEVVASKSMEDNIGAIRLVLPEMESQAGSIGANGFILTTTQVDPKTGAETHFADAIYIPR